MKIKEIDRTANVAWSPVEVDPVYLAVGTAAQQLDSSFSTNATLELYQFDTNQSGLDLPVKATLPCENRFHKLIWGSHGISGDKGEHPMGIIVGGCDGGVMQVYDAAKVLKNDNPLVLTKTKHTGAVRALDFNPFRSNLVASGASESEIFIWDLTNPKTPMTPGTKVQPADDVSHLAWNKQVEHILASTFSTRCVVWDLRKNEPVIKVSDTTSRIRYKVVEWHPEVATQMCLASEDDNNPVIQLWDLRYATAPLKVIQGHQRGILGMAWCSQDSDLLLTCGKEARILCWNPNFPHPGYEMVCDIPTSSQYSFDVSFCPKNPVVIASSSYDGRVSIFGLSGGVQHPVTSSKLADSFPGMDMTLSAPLPSQQPAFLQLRDAPKWLKRPCGASFGFGGKLVSFTNTKVAPTQPGQAPTVTSVVSVLQLVTLPNLIERSKKLEDTLQSGSLESYCAQKAAESSDSSEAQIWDFLQANFSQHPRQEYLSKLGFNASEIMAKLGSKVSDSTMNGVVDEFEALGRGAPDGYANGYEFGSGGGSIAKPEKELEVPTDDNSVDGKINQALLCGNIDVAVNLCVEDERWADALLLASKATPETLMKVQNKYFEKCQSEATQMIRAVVTHDLAKLVDRCSLDSWKQVLAVVTTYADNKEFPILADMLGQRLQSSQVESQKLGALLCCICSGNLNHLVDVWISDSDKHRGNTPDELQDLVEQIMILKKAGEMWGRENNVDGGSVASKLIQYSGLLASQGCLELALSFLGECNDPEVELFKERLYLSLRSPRPIKTQRQTRSRQTSESSMRSSFTKRPAYPNTNLGSSRPVFSSSEFDNLTGPVHPPQPSYLSNNPQQSAYGNVYVNPNVPPTVGQYSPPSASSQYGSASVGLPPRVPSSTMTGSIYTPAEVPRSSMMPPAKEPPPARTPLGSSLPHPPVSSAAHGWNDPPPMKTSNKPKPTPTTLASTIQPITHPIFGSAAPPEPSNPYGNSPMMPPPPQQQTIYSPSSTSYGQSSNSGYPPQQSSNFGPPPSQMGPPPTMSQSPYYSSGQSSFGQPPPTSQQQPFGQAPPTSQQSFGPPPTSQQSFGPPPTSQQQPFGQPPPTSQQSFGPPPTSQQQPFGQAPPTSQQSFGPPPTSQQQPFGQPPPTSQSPFGKPSAPQVAFPPPPLHTGQVGYRPSTPVQSAFASPPTAQTLGGPPLTKPMMPPPPGPGGFSAPAPMDAPILRPPSQTGPPPSMNYFGAAPVEPPPPQFSNNNAVSNSSPFAPPSFNTFNPTQNQQFNPLPSNSSNVASTTPPFVPNPASTFQPINPPAPTPPPPAKVAEPPKPLGPIPPEHATLVDTLEKLRSECYDVAHLIQMKRKLEDVARKLDAFSEKLRNGSLTESTLTTLHSLVDAIRTKDYQQALQIHTQLVSAGNFAEISTFLPAIKVLIQSATQLSV